MHTDHLAKQNPERIPTLLDRVNQLEEQFANARNEYRAETSALRHRVSHLEMVLGTSDIPPEICAPPEALQWAGNGIASARPGSTY